jgi:hypothetical protein
VVQVNFVLLRDQLVPVVNEDDCAKQHLKTLIADFEDVVDVCAVAFVPVTNYDSARESARQNHKHNQNKRD